MSDKNASHYVDAHVHIWTNDVYKYGLASAFTAEDMKPPAYLPDQILCHARPSRVDRVVLVQMNYYGFNNSYMLDAIKHFPQFFRGIAVVDGNSEAPDVEMRRLAKLGVRGFRLYPEEASSSNLEKKGFAKMFRCGEKDRLALCFLVNPDALAAVDRQCKKFPYAPIVIDHLARIGYGGLTRDSDVRALCALSKHAQVWVKVSAFYALGQAKSPHLDLVPLIKRVYEAFGPRRLMWGSDCPFQVAQETYEDSISLIRDRLDFISIEDKEWILGRTAEELFFN
ncbi:MAG: amidohydrolase family protein [Candidatus Sulfotelmatobacter sp.]